MLVLSRKPSQSIMIGDGVEVQVLSVAGEKVRLGITAPREVSIFRNEVYERIESERRGRPPSRAARDRGRRRAPSQERASSTLVVEASGLSPLAHQPGERLEHRDDHGDDRDRQADEQNAEPDLAP